MTAAPDPNAPTAAPPSGILDYDDFARVDIRVGTITDAQPFPEARKPAFKLWIDFGAPIGIKQSSAQITRHYKADQLIGRQVCAVVNLAPRQIGPFISEVLTLGMPDASGEVVLVRPDHKVPDGGKLF
jgi:tRNA-binding protein